MTWSSLATEHEQGGGWGGWLHKLAMWDWHKRQLHGYPGWDTFRRPDGAHPAWVHLHHVRREGEGEPESRRLAVAFDDRATAAFYYRDWTGDGIPFVRDGEGYQSRFWFARATDQDIFLAMLDEMGITPRGWFPEPGEDHGEVVHA